MVLVMRLDERRPSRVIIDKLQPQIDGGAFAAKRYMGEEIEVISILLVDGHDHLKGRLLYRHESEAEFQRIPLHTSPADIGNDRWRACFRPEKLGRYWITVEAAIDRYGTWETDIQKKFNAGQDISVDLLAGAELLRNWMDEVNVPEKKVLRPAIEQLQEWSQDYSELSALDLKTFIENREILDIADEIYDEDSFVRYPKEIPIQVEPELGRFSSWYEFFPRSTVEGDLRHGTLREAEGRLEYVQNLGFNIVYLPPIHPIGSAFKKGKNNTLDASDEDVGSPWAIGSSEGGHKSIHPLLGDFHDFDRFVKKANTLGLEVALDIAFQCSPDHPYVKEHPEWFKKRPDGSIQYAENPPKKYQDIYPFDFETREWRSLWQELKSIFEFWIEKGVKIFRVDNPHTKSFHFWEWVIREIKYENPEVLFLSEAFTRPQMMAYLAKSGFSQSYTYFTWRNSKWELTQYLTELTQTELVDYFGANFWPNTPDILPFSLQHPNRNMFIQRLILAATLSSNYGLYGPAYELMEYEPFASGKEEYLHSEKYELKRWDLDKPESLAPVLKKLNEIRNAHKPLQQNRTLRFHPVNNDAILAYSKSSGDERILVVVSLDPDRMQAGQVELPLQEWGIDPERNFTLRDLLTDSSYHWMGWRNYVEFRPQDWPAHILRLER